MKTAPERKYGDRARKAAELALDQARIDIDDLVSNHPDDYGGIANAYCRAFACALMLNDPDFDAERVPSGWIYEIETAPESLTDAAAGAMVFDAASERVAFEDSFLSDDRASAVAARIAEAVRKFEHGRRRHS